MFVFLAMDAHYNMTLFYGCTLWCDVFLVAGQVLVLKWETSVTLSGAF